MEHSSDELALPAVGIATAPTRSSSGASADQDETRRLRLAGVRALPPEPGAPPWLLLWALLTVATLPSWIAHLSRAFAEGWRSYGGTALFGSELARTLDLPTLLELAPLAALYLGLVLALLPGLRARRLERRYGLREGAPRSRALAELHHLIERAAPGIEVRVNLQLEEELAFVYPAGFRRPAVAIFGGLVRLWGEDREAAEAVLLHELHHSRRGDGLLIGAGSFLAWLARRWWLLASVLMVLPVAVVWLEVAIGEAGRAASEAGRYPEGALLVELLASSLPRLLLLALAQLPWVLAALSVLVAGIWCVEIEADRAVAESPLKAGLMRALDRGCGKIGPWRWLLHRLSHPPPALRRWLVRRAGEPVALFFLLALFPLAYAVRLVLLLLWRGLSVLALPAAAGADPAADALTPFAAGEVGAYLHGAALPLALYAGLLLVWPLAAGPWRRVVGSGVRSAALDRERESETGDPGAARRWTGSWDSYLGLAALCLLIAVGFRLPAWTKAAVPVEAAAARQVVVVTERSVYLPDEEIVVRYGGMPGNPQDWVNVVLAGAPEEEWGCWTYTRGQREGSWTVEPQPPGEYEVRAYFDWAEGGYEVQGRARFVVAEE